MPGESLADASANAASEGVTRFLLNPLSYPHRPAEVRLVQTHASLVFITPPFVYKVKRPVNFGFLDFSTLEKRRHFCEREVLLNRRLCPDLYLGVLPIWRVNGGFSFAGGRDVAEYAVQMRKLPDHGFLDQLAREGRLKASDLDCVVAKLKHFYEAQHPDRRIEEWGEIERLKLSTDENFRQAAPFVGRALSRAAFDAIRVFTDEFYRRRAALFESRVRRKRIRDCHGDLRLEHIHLSPRALHIYDCIEFNDRFRYVDVASDAAFLAMDLDFEGRPDLARYFTVKLSRALQDEEMLSLMDFYKCYRAFVRGKVECLRSVAPSAREAERLAGAERAARYFRLALRYAVAGSQPLALVVMGRIASGKSTLARALGAELEWPVISSDLVRKEMAGLPLHERADEQTRARLYSGEMTARTYKRLLQRAGTELNAGRSAILDGTFAKQWQRRQLRKCIEQTGAPVRLIEVRADDATVKHRLADRERRFGEISDARLEDFEALNALYEPPVEADMPAPVTIPTTGPLPETVTRALLAMIEASLEAEERQRPPADQRTGAACSKGAARAEKWPFEPPQRSEGRPSP